jgi:hypothetical protein
MTQRWGQRATPDCRGAVPVFQRSQAPAILSPPFPVGVRFLKVLEGFIPVHAPKKAFHNNERMGMGWPRK